MKTNALIYRYPGTKPFNADESVLFKGRDEDVQQLYELITIQNLVVLYGRSGLGKSSLLNAGLTSRLAENPNISSLFVRFGAYYNGNGSTPLQKVNDIIREAYEPDVDNFLHQKLMPDAERAANALWYLFKSQQVKNTDVNTFVLIFDQFEELFSYDEAAINLFKEELSELLYVKVPQPVRNFLKEKLQANRDYLTKEEAVLLFAPLTIKVVFSIRSDKLSLLNNLSDVFPGILKTYYELKPLNRMQAEQAIALPAQLTDKSYAASPYTFEKDALDLILDSLNSPDKKENSYAENRQGIETFQLQIVCKYVENMAIEKSLAVVSKANLGNIKDVFENHYTNIIKKLPAADQDTARKLIEEKLIIDGARVCMPIPFLLNNMKEDGITTVLLDELVNTHILRPEHNNAIEVSHDTLIEPILKSREKRIAEQKQKKLFLYRLIAAGVFFALLIVASVWIAANYKAQQYTDPNAVRVIDSLSKRTDSVTKVANVASKALDSIVDQKKADSIYNMKKTDSLLTELIRYRGAPDKRIEIQYRCLNQKDADSGLLALLTNRAGYTNVHWSKASANAKANNMKPNALFYGVGIPLEDVQIIMLSLIKAGYKIQRVADIANPTHYTVQIWASPDNKNAPALAVTDVENAEIPAALNRGTKIR